MKHFRKIDFKHLILLLGCLSAVIIFDSCTCKRTAEKSSEKIIEKAVGEDADVDIDKEKVTIKTDEGTFTADASVNNWPDEIPGDVPEFKHGKIISVSTQNMGDSKNWVVIYEEVSPTALKEYQEELEAQGFDISYTTIVASGGHLAAEKGELAVMLMAGEGNATVTIGSKQ